MRLFGVPSWTIGFATVLGVGIFALLHAGRSPETESFRLAQYAAAPFAFPQLYQCPSAPLPGPYKTMNSQAKEDVFLWDNYFSKVLPANYEGTFVEIGALDGFRYANTLFYEHYLKWRARKAERPRSHYFAMSICGVEPRWDGKKHTIKFLNQSYHPAVATALEEGYSSKKFLDSWHADRDKRTSVSVGCLPMQPVLEMTGILDIDLFSLDVEGGELMIIRTIDFAITNIRVIVVEADGHDPSKDAAVGRFLLDAGFERAFQNYRNQTGSMDNDFYINHRFDEIRQARRGKWSSTQHRFISGTGSVCP
ncbi:hypothetical protein DFJ74DRAFT_644450 [Hyaloraphidium curvatum]|nr:hypothetical protein DFJ74DRAFT_644450 [Hyaloraphidium curvatum]